MTLGLHPVSNSTRPFECSIKNDGHGKSSMVLSPPCISSDIGAESCAPGSAHIRRALESAISHLAWEPSVSPFSPGGSLCHVPHLPSESRTRRISTKWSIDDLPGAHYRWKREII